jgi:2-dehydro-3-deoxyphosphogluconate aldolase / (4S)-4-hydroxy-2-oxoglutarate aldolase
MPAMRALEQILEYKIIAILRGCTPDRISDIAVALAEGGVRLMEITLNSPGALESIRQLSGVMGDRMLVGAGTVLTAAEAEAAVDAGARFIISPTLDVGTIQRTRQLGAISIPGAFTPTEILTAYRNGADIIKVFPAGSSGASYFKELRGPLPYIPLMPTGGVNLDNIRDFKAAGAVAFGISSALVPAGQENTGPALRQLTEKAAAYIKAVQ